jgi:transposase InsO family protein
MNVAFEKDRPYRGCKVGKQMGALCHANNIMTTTRPLEMLYMDLFDPIVYISIGGNKYGLIIIDDYSHFIWVFFLQDKGETQEVLKKFLKRAQNKFDAKVKRIRSDNDTEFKNTQVEDYLGEKGIKHEFSTPYTPQQNGVAERKNRTLIEMERIMLDEYKTSDRFWTKAVNTACHATNCLYLHKLLKKILYELITGNKSNVSYFRVFGSKCMFFKRSQSLLNLLLKYMKVSCLAMTQTHAHIVFSTRTPVVLKPHVTWCLMRLMASKWSNMTLML